MESQSTVFVIDDDQAMRESLRWLLESAGFRVQLFDAPERFLAEGADSRPGCLLLDVQMPTMNGLELQDRLAHQNCLMPIIVITGYGEVPMAVRAMKRGAVDFIEKPFNDEELLDRVRRALELDERRRGEASHRETIETRLARLTPREREVMALVVKGSANKEIAFKLGISPKTVEIHRANVMRKSEAGSVADLVRMAELTQTSSA